MAPNLRLVPPPTEASDGAAAGEPSAAPVAARPAELSARERKLVELGLPMLDRIVADFAHRHHVEEAELLGPGAVALQQAALNFREGECESFLHFAKCHVRGAVADAVGAGRASLRVRVERAMERAFCGFSATHVIGVDLVADPNETLVDGTRQSLADAVATAFIASMIAEPKASPEDELAELEGRRGQGDALEEAMAELYPHEREVIRMMYWEEMQLKEVALALGIHRNTVRNRHESGLRKLRKLLSGGKT